MEQDFTCEPKPKNVRAMTAALLCLLLAIGCWTASTLGAPYKLIWQTAAVCLLVAGIVFVTRYLVRVYTYTLYRDDREDSEPEISHWAFKIVEVQSGKRRRIVCHLDAPDILGIYPKPETAEEKAAQKEALAGCKTYRYCSEFMPQAYCRLKIRNGDETVCVLFQPDEKMRAALEQLLASQAPD